MLPVYGTLDVADIVTCVLLFSYSIGIGDEIATSFTSNGKIRIESRSARIAFIPVMPRGANVGAGSSAYAWIDRVVTVWLGLLSMYPWMDLARTAIS